MEINNIVIVSLASPREKVWGQLTGMRIEGVTIRGIELGSFDDFIRQVASRDENTMGMTEVFYPMHRVERIMADEPCGSLPSLSQRFSKTTGMDIQEYLRAQS